MIPPAQQGIDEQLYFCSSAPWSAGRLAQNCSLEAYLCSTTPQHSTEIQLRMFCVLVLASNHCTASIHHAAYSFKPA